MKITSEKQSWDKANKSNKIFNTVYEYPEIKSSISKIHEGFTPISLPPLSDLLSGGANA